MAARPGTRRGWQETLSTSNSAAASARPGTRGKAYLQQPAASSPERPTSRRGPVSQQLQQPAQQLQPQLQQRSAWEPPQHTAAAQPTKAAANNAGLRHAAPPLQEHPSYMSVSLSDLDGMSSSMSVGAASIDITTASSTAGAAPHGTQQPQRHMPAAISSKQERQQLQPAAAEVWQLDHQQCKQQTNLKTAQAKRTQEPAAVNSIPSAKAAAAAPAAEPSQTLGMSEPSGYSSDFLSLQGSEIEIVYSQSSIERAAVSQQQHKQQQQQLSGLNQPSGTVTDIAGSKLAGRAVAVSDAAAPQHQPNSSNLVADDSIISGDIEFSNSSIAVGAADSNAAGTVTAKAMQPASKAADKQTATAAMQAASKPAAATATGGRRAAESNLQLSEGSKLSFSSADIEFDGSVNNIHPGATGAAVAAQPSMKVQPLVPSAQQAAAVVGAQEAAAATDELFATLTAVPRRSDSSNDGTNSCSVGSGDDSPSLRNSSRKGHNSSHRRSSSISSSAEVATSAAATGSAANTQLLPADAMDVLAGLEQLHGTLQVVRGRSSGSSSSSSNETGECDSEGDISSSRISRGTSSKRSQRQGARKASSAASIHLQHGASGGSEQLSRTPTAAAAAAYQAAAETEVLLSSLQVVQQYGASASYSEDFQTMSIEASNSSQGQQRQQQQYPTSQHGQSLHNTDRCQPQGKHQPQSASQTVSCDIDELLQQGAAAAANFNSNGLIKSTNPGPQAKRRSIALQVGSSNDKATQVVFDEQRHVLWDGGCLLQQQQPRRNLGRWGNPPPAAAAAAAPGQYGIPAAAPVPTSLRQVLPGSLGLSGGHGSCWSVLSATLQQLRAAAVLDQLEGLLRAAAQQPAPQTVVQRQPKPQQQQQQQPLVAAKLPEAQPQAVSQATTGYAGWFTIPSEGVLTVPAPSVPLQQQQQQEQQQEQQQHRQQATSISLSQHGAAHADAVSSNTAGWVTLPTAGSAAAHAAQGLTESTAMMDAIADLPAAQPVIDEDPGWFSLPVPAVASNQEQQVQNQQSSRTVNSQAEAIAAAAAGAEAQANVPEDVGWFVLPLPGTSVAGIAATVAAAAPAQQPEAPTAPADVWLQLPSASGAAQNTTAQLAHCDTAEPGHRYKTLPVSIAPAPAADAASTAPLPDARKPESASMPAVSAVHSEVYSTLAGSVSQQYSPLATTVSSSAEWGAAEMQGGPVVAGQTPPPAAAAAAAAAAAGQGCIASSQQDINGCETPSQGLLVSGLDGENTGGLQLAADGGCASSVQTRGVVEAGPAAVGGSTCRSAQPWVQIDGLATAAGDTGPAHLAEDDSMRHSRYVNSSAIQGDQQQLPPHRPQQQQQQQQPSSVDTMLRYLSYLNSMSSQGLAPPGLTLSTARALRENLLQTIATAQQQHWGPPQNGQGGDVHRLSGLAAAAAAAAPYVGPLSNLCYEDMISSCCLDSFMSSSLTHIRRKLGRPTITTAWGSSDIHPQAGGRHDAATEGEAAATSGVYPVQQKPDQGRSTASCDCATPGRQYGGVFHGARHGQLMQQGKQRHRYTTLEDTLEFIWQHRTGSLGGGRSAAQRSSFKTNQ